MSIHKGMWQQPAVIMKKGARVRGQDDAEKVSGQNSDW
jgi:hypothetical protein